MYFTSGQGTLIWSHWSRQVFPVLSSACGSHSSSRFAVLGGIFPFHNWSPDGHVAAPTAVSMFHAGVLMKLGAFAALRVGIMLLPEGAKFWMPWIILLTLVNVVYGAYIASVQTDFKYMVGFSSVSHMGLVIMGFATLSQYGLLGAGVQMFSHGVMTALFFAVVGMVYDQAHTREIPRLGGFRKFMPLVAVAFIVGGLVSMGMAAVFRFYRRVSDLYGCMGSPTMDRDCCLNLHRYHGIVHYPDHWAGFLWGGPDEFQGHIHDVTVLDKVALVFLSAILIVVGIYPTIMVPLVESGVQSILRLLGGA